MSKLRLLASAAAIVLVSLPLGTTSAQAQTRVITSCSEVAIPASVRNVISANSGNPVALRAAIAQLLTTNPGLGAAVACASNAVGAGDRAAIAAGYADAANNLALVNPGAAQALANAAPLGGFAVLAGGGGGGGGGDAPNFLLGAIPGASFGRTPSPN